MEQAVAEHQIVPGARQRGGGQERFLEADATAEPRCVGGRARQRQHRRRRVEAIDCPVWEGANEAQRDVARAAAEVEPGAAVRQIGDALAQQSDEAAVRFLEVGLGVGTA
jgi:hypothetical protein